MIKRVKAFLICLCLILTTVGCGNNQEEFGTNNTNKKYTYSGSFDTKSLIKLNDKFKGNINIIDVAYINNDVVVLSEKYTESGITVYCTIADLDGNITNEYEVYSQGINTASDSYGFKLINNNNIAYIENQITDESATNNLVIFNISTAELYKLDITEYVGSGVYVNSIAELSNHNLNLVCNNKIINVPYSDKENSITCLDITDVNMLTIPVIYNEDNPIFINWDNVENKNYLIEIDKSSGEIIKNKSVVVDFSKFTPIKVRNTDSMILSSSDALYSYDLNTGEVIELMNYMNSNLNASSFKSVTFIDDKSFIGEYTENNEMSSKFALFTPLEDDSESSKEKITLVAIKTTDDLKRAIIEYNTNSEDFKIELIDCKGNVNDFNKNVEDNEADIVFLDEFNNLDKYTREEKFIDIYSLMKKDKSFNKNDYATNFFEAFEINDKLYQIPTKVLVSTVIGKESIFSEYKGINWEEFDNLDEIYPESIKIKGDSKHSMFLTSLNFAYFDLIDINNNTSDFSSEEYSKLLELSNTFEQGTSSHGSSINTDLSNSEYEIVDSSILLAPVHIYSVYDAWLYGYRTFGEETSLVGFPSKSKNGNVVSAVSSFLIMKESSNIEQSWELIKIMLSDKYQIGEENRMYASESLPVLKEAIKLQADTLSKRPFYLDSEGNKVEYSNKFWIDDQIVEIKPASKDKADQWYEFLLSVNKRSGIGHTEEYNIILNEAEHYFNGTYSAEEVALSTQSYMSTHIQYLNTEE